MTERRHRLRMVAIGLAAAGLALAGTAEIGAGQTMAPANARAPDLAEPSAPPGRRVTITLPGSDPVTLYYEETGEGPPVLLLHGLGESTFTWHEIAPRLALTHRVIALDLKGFGRSEKPEDGTYDAEDQAALVARFLIERDLTGVSLVGHSFGGTVALRTALADGIRGTGRVRRIAVIGAPALPRSTARHLDLVNTPGLPDMMASALSAEFLARLLLNEAMGGVGELSKEMIEGYAAPYREPGAMQAFLATARAIVNEEGAEAIARRYRKLGVPVLVVWCRRDPIVPLRAGRRLAAALPSARLRIVEGCHHLPQHERPEALLELLDGFLEN